MGIFDKFKGEVIGRTTKGFYFGHTEAEGENKAGLQNLDHYFEDYLGVLPKVSDEKFIFVGRKGAGKSAIAKFLKDSSDKEENSYADIIKFDEVELEYIVQRIPTDERENIELIIFEWLILVRLVKLFTKNDEAKQTREYTKFKAFIERNSGFIEIDKLHINEVVEKKKMEIGIEPLKQIFPLNIGKYIDVKKVKVPFYQFVNPLKDIIKEVIKYEVFKDKEYIILFDDLDVKFRVESEESKAKLLSLIRAAKNLNTTVFRNTKIKVLIFLRDDVKKALETSESDTSKIFSSYEIPLIWYDHHNFKISEDHVKLKHFANRRIKLNFEANNIPYNTSDPWGSLFINTGMSEEKSSFKHLIDYTFYRPRDIVLFLSEIGNNEYYYPIDNGHMRILIQKFIASNIKELKSELVIHFSDIEISNVFSALKKICGINDITREDALSILEEKLPNKDPQNVLDLLLGYSIFGYKDSEGRVYFNYRDNPDTVDFDKMFLTVHKSVFKYFYPDKNIELP